MRMSDHSRLITRNKKALHEYLLVDTWEAGIVLAGSEVKACRMGKASLRDSYARIEHGEIYLVNVHISPYPYANRFNHDPLRKRKLLLHKGEIKKLYGKLREKGQTFIPLKMYFSTRGKVKVEMALVRGKKLHDRRETIRRRDLDREAAAALKNKR